MEVHVHLRMHGSNSSFAIAGTVRSTGYVLLEHMPRTSRRVGGDYKGVKLLQRLAQHCFAMQFGTQAEMATASEDWWLSISKFYFLLQFLCKRLVEKLVHLSM